MDDVRTLARDLVEIPSHEDESAAGDHIETWLRRETDADVTRDAHGNVTARRGSGDCSLALVGHHDVVAPGKNQQTATGYAVTEREGRLYGRGSADMKGAVSASMCAFRDAALDGGELVFASFVGEERGGIGAQAAIEDGFSPTYAVVGEGSTGYSSAGVVDVAVAHKGRRASTITAAGKTAHASEPERGVNAIYRAGRALDWIEACEPPRTTVLGHELSGSVVATEIEGGSGWNVIPDSCTITVDERTVPGERAPLSELSALPGLSVDIEQDLPPMACDAPGFAALVLSAATAVQDGSPAHVVKPHATDAGWLADAGTECVICGAAEPGEAHTDDESVSLAALDRCYEIYRQVSESFVDAL